MATKGAQQRTQKGQSVLNLTDEQAREHVEKLLWPNGEPVCRHCGSVNAYRMQGKSCRPGLCRCRDCKKQFTVTVGTIFEDSHLPLSTWVKAIHLMCSSKKGISALQLMRNLGLGSYRTAWFMAHRIRLAMRCEPVAGMLLKGEVQVDETYVGANRARVLPMPKDKVRVRRKPGRGTDKVPVMLAVETDGRAYAQPVANAKADTLKAVMVEKIDPSSTIVTDEWAAYNRAARDFIGGHYKVRHSWGEYERDGRHTNTAESSFSLLKRGIYGTFHHVSRGHLHRYCDEFSFRWNGRKLSDAERRERAITQVEGKRLMLVAPAIGGD